MERIPPIDVQLARLPIGENDRRGCWGRGGGGDRSGHFSERGGRGGGPQLKVRV